VELTRRSFFGTAATAAAASSVLQLKTPVPAVAQTPVVAPPPPPRPAFHILGEQRPVGNMGALIRQLSDDVFLRLTAALAGRSFEVLDGSRLGEKFHRWIDGDIYQTRGLSRNLNTSYELDWSTPETFTDVERFREFTSRWTEGLLICTGGGPSNTVEAFADLSFVGTPNLPKGVEWAVYYVDEQTGLVMRAIAAFDIIRDRMVLRYDVLAG
jgi:hypothetical protein